MRLTDLRVQSLPSPDKGQKSYRCDSLPGFMCRVSQAGTKTFCLMVGRDRQLVSIGRYPVISLAEARQVAKELLAERTLGKHRPARVRFSDALEKFLVEKEAKNKASTYATTKGILNKHFKHLHASNLEDITPDDIAKITDRLLKKEQPSAANHVLVAGKTFFKWCARRGYIQHSPVENLERPSKLVSRERVLSDEELRAVWKAAEDCGQFGTIVKLLIVTGQRRSEIGSLKSEWCSLGGERNNSGYNDRDGSSLGVGGNSASLSANTDCEVMGEELGKAALSPARFHETLTTHQCTITIPKEYTKNKRAHTFPLGGLTSSLLFSCSLGSGFLFWARGSDGTKPFNGWSKAKAQLDKKASDHLRDTTKEIMPWTLHDLRRTYATNLQRLGIKLEVIEALLNHVSGTRAGIVGVYNRHRYEAEMREAVAAFEKWFTATILTD